MKMHNIVMTIKEIFNGFIARYGEGFPWRLFSTSKSASLFINELKKEAKDISNYNIYAIAKNDANDDVLFLLCSGSDCAYRIYHLTYSKNDTADYPTYEEFTDIKAVELFIEQQFINAYLT